VVEKVGLTKHQDQHTFSNQPPVPPAPVMKLDEDQIGSHEMPMDTIGDKKDLGMEQLHGRKPICEPSELQNMKSTLHHRQVPEPGLHEGVKAAFLHDREHRHKGLGEKIKEKLPHHETGHLKGSEMGNVTGGYGMGHHERGFDEAGHVTGPAGRIEGPLEGHELRTEGKHEIDSVPKKSKGQKMKEKLFGKKTHHTDHTIGSVDSTHAPTQIHDSTKLPTQTHDSTHLPTQGQTDWNRDTLGTETHQAPHHERKPEIM